ncbi:MAG: T9SS C-terminal target domain-containing protein, partial [Bacteroidetes bacterium]
YDAANQYNRVVFFPDFGNMGVAGGEDFYFDDLVNKGTVSVDVLEQLSFSVFPNPARQWINIRYELPVSAKVSFSLLDLSGKEVKRLEQGQLAAGVQQARLQPGQLAAGTYLLLIELDGRRVKYQKIMLH